MTPASQREGNATADWEAMLHALQSRHRRRLLVNLLDHNPKEDTLRVPDDVVGSEDPERLREQLFHQHLPLLEGGGYIRWDQDTHEVEQGPRFNNIRPMVQLMHDHQDELPPGWL